MKNYMIRCLLALSLCSFSGCCSKKEMVNQTEKTSDETFRVLIQDSNINVTEEKVIVIDNQEKLLAFYATLNETRTPGFVAPVVNFKNQSVIVVAMGQKSTGGYTLSVPKFVKSESLFEFYYIMPKPREPVTMSMTTPGIVVLANQTSDTFVVRVNDK
jgi:hypothetical protein